MAAMVELAMLLLASSAAADERVLLVAGLPPTDEADLRAALSRSLGAEVLAPSDLRRALEEEASELGEDEARTRAAARTREGHEAYVELRLDVAMRAFEAAGTALMTARHEPPDAHALAELAFKRALVAMAAQRNDDARADLVRALTLEPAFAPDREVYGPLVFELLRAARSDRRLRERSAIRIDRAPADAIVFVDGERVDGPEATVRGPGPHLVVATRLGHVPRAELVSAGRDARVAIVLEPARGPLLAKQLLAHWDERGSDRTLHDVFGEDAAVLAARACDARFVVRASAAGGELALVLAEAESGDVVRMVEGGRLPWEDTPYFVLAEALAGREVLRPGEPGAPIATLAAPSSVEPSSPLRLLVTLDDPASRVRAVAGRCGEARARVELERSARSARREVPLVLESPGAEGTIACVASLLSAGDDVLLTLPGDGALEVEVVESGAGVPWYLWVGIAVAVVAGGVAIALATLESDQTLVFTVNE
jgi:hypothetical protein